MTALVYQIVEDSTGDIIEEGIVQDLYSNIYPGQTSDDRLPYETVVYEFEVEGFTLNAHYISISYEESLKFKF